MEKAYSAYVCFEVKGFGGSWLDDSGLIVTISVDDPSILGFWVDDQPGLVTQRMWKNSFWQLALVGTTW